MEIFQILLTLTDIPEAGDCGHVQLSDYVQIINS